MADLIEVPDDEIDELEQQINSQTVERGQGRSIDPTYPVFRVSDYIGKRVLLYGPRTTGKGGTVGDDDKLNVERSLVYQVRIGRYPQRIRCIAGITKVPGYTGIDPIEEVLGQVQEVVGQHIDHDLGPDTTSTEAEKEARTEAIRKLYQTYGIVESPVAQIVIPVYVFELSGNEGVNFAKDEQGNTIQPKLAWYIISERKYEQTFLTQMRNQSIKSPAGQFFIVTYPQNPKSNSPDARYAGGNMTVSVYSPPENSTLRKNASALDTAASNPEHPWTRAIARKTLPEFGFKPLEEYQHIASQATEKLRLISGVSSANPIGVQTNLAPAQLPPGLVDSQPAAASAEEAPAAKPQPLSAVPVQF